MAHLDKNGIAIAVGQSVRLKFPGTDDLCVGRVVGIDFGGIDIEAEHFGAKQSVVVKADTLEFVANDMIASLEVRLEAARNALGAAETAIVTSYDAERQAKAQLDLALRSSSDAKDRSIKALQLVDLLTQQLSEAKAKLADEEAAKEAHGNDPHTLEATGLQVMAPPIIDSSFVPWQPPVPATSANPLPVPALDPPATGTNIDAPPTV